jgi:hypothetical protein
LGGGEAAEGFAATAGDLPRLWRWGLGEAFTGFDGSGIPGDVPDDAALLGGADERFVSVLGEFGMGEFGEGS